MKTFGLCIPLYVLVTILCLLTLEERTFRTETVESKGDTGKAEKGTCDGYGSEALTAKVVSNKVKGDWWGKRVVETDKEKGSKVGAEGLEIVS